MKTFRVSTVALFVFALGALSTCLSAQTILLSENFEGPPAWTSGTPMNQNGWSTVNTGVGGQNPLWNHEAHRGPLVPGGPGHPSPKPHITQRLGNTNAGLAGDNFAANLHWRAPAGGTASHPGGYAIELISPPFAAAPLGTVADGDVLTIEFDVAIDLLIDNNAAGFTHFIDVALRDVNAPLGTPDVPISNPAPAAPFPRPETATRMDRTRFVYEVNLQGFGIPIPTNSDASDWVLVLTASSGAAMNTDLYDFLVDDIAVRLNYHLQTGGDAFENPGIGGNWWDPAAPNNDTMTHPHERPPVLPGSIDPFGPASANGPAFADEDHYAFAAGQSGIVPPLGGPGTGVAVQVAITPGGAGALEAYLYRVTAGGPDGTGMFWPVPGAAGSKFLSAICVAYTNTALTVSGSLDLHAQFHSECWYIVRVVSVVPGANVPYTVVIFDPGTDDYVLDGEGAFGAGHNDTMATATLLPGLGAAMPAILHPGDEDWYIIPADIAMNAPLLVNITDTTGTTFPFGATDGIEVALYLAPGGPGTVARIVDIDETGPDPAAGWAGSQAEVFHSPPFVVPSPGYFVRVSRGWQTTIADRVGLSGFPPRVATYTITWSAAAQTVHAPAPPPPAPLTACVFNPGAVTITASGGTYPTGVAFTMTTTTGVGHPDHNFIWEATVPPGAPAPVFTTLPTGSIVLTSWAWTAPSPGPVFGTTFTRTELLYGRVTSGSDPTVTIPITFFP